MTVTRRTAARGGLAGTLALGGLLPAPKGKFQLMLRVYWPTETQPSIIDGTWSPPPTKKVA